MSILVTVGLPARGKSYISHKLKRSLKWIGYNVRVFNAGEWRRNNYNLNTNGDCLNETFFNKDSIGLRDQIAIECFDELLNWLAISDNKAVAIFDATNTTVERRALLIDMVQSRYKLIFIESIVDNQDVVDANISMKQYSPDYIGKKKEDVVNDFKIRLEHYESVYQTITKNEGIPYIKTINVSDEIKLYNVKGMFENDLIFFMNNIIITRPTIYLTRHGQSEYNVKELLGGDSSITELGQNYATNFRNFIEQDNGPNFSKIKLYCSTLKRTLQTSQPLIDKGIECCIRKDLDEIHAGKFDGLGYSDILRNNPDEFEARKKDKLRYRYPMGESYLDLIDRIKTIMMEIETNTDPTIIVSHQATLRVIYAYFMGIEQKDIPHCEIPLHTVIKLTPHSHKYKVDIIKLNH